MSQNPSGEVNPYAAPQYSGPERIQESLRNYPIYCRVVFSFDFLLLLVRGTLAVSACKTLAELGDLIDNDWFYVLGVCEAATGILMFVLGVPAALGMLLEKRWAVWLAWGKVIVTLGSILVGILQIEFVLYQFQLGKPEYFGAIIGVIFAIAFRLLLLALYAWAVVLFSRWLAGKEIQQARNSASRNP